MRVCLVRVEEIIFYQLINIHAFILHLNLDYD